MTRDSPQAALSSEAMTQASKPDRERDFSVDEKLLAIAYSGGSTASAAKMLGVDRKQLYDIKKDHRERYLKLMRERGAELEEMAAANARELIIRTAQIEHTVLDVVNEKLRLAAMEMPRAENYRTREEYELALEVWSERPDAKEINLLASALRSLTTSKGINGTKLLELTGRPTHVIGYEDPLQAGRALLARYGIVDSTAEEVEQAALEAPDE